MHLSCVALSAGEELTLWGRVTRICVGKLAIIDSDNGLFGTKPSSEAIWYTDTWTLRNKRQWNFNQNSNISIQENTSSAKWRPFCLTLKVLNHSIRRHDVSDKNIGIIDPAYWSQVLLVRQIIQHNMIHKTTSQPQPMLYLIDALVWNVKCCSATKLIQS